MKTRVTIDDDLLRRAKLFSGIENDPKLVQRSIEYIVAYEKAKRRAAEMNDYHEVRRTVERLYDKVEED